MNHLIDTNVLIAATAHGSPERDATPDDPALRKQVFDWLDAVSNSDEPIVLDCRYTISNEYSNNLNDQDFGIQVIHRKMDKGEVEWAMFDLDANGFGILPSALSSATWDNSDKKFGAAAHAVKSGGKDVQIVNASDSDWFDVAAVLKAAGIGLHQIIEAWSRAKYREKNGRDAPIV